MTNSVPINFRFGQYELWRGGLPPRSDFEPVSTLVEEFEGYSPTVNGDTIFAAAKTRSNGMYGLLGASFTPFDDTKLRVEVATSGSDPTHPRQGINVRFAMSVMDAIIRLATLGGEDLAVLGAGDLSFAYANQHPVESSRRGFQRLALIVVWLLRPDIISLSKDELIDAFAYLRLP